jgi:hypothetical protein
VKELGLHVSMKISKTLNFCKSAGVSQNKTVITGEHSYEKQAQHHELNLFSDIETSI